MPAILLLFALMTVIVVVVGWAFSWRSKKANAWRRFAADHGLRIRESTWTDPPVISGTFNSTAVVITIEYRGSGNSRKAYTKASALFTTGLPRGLKLGREGFGTSLAKIFGGQDIQVGVPKVDDALRIQGEDAASIAKLLQNEVVAKTVVAFINGGDEAMITETEAIILMSGHASRTDQLQYLTDRANHAVRGVEHALRWDPGQAGDHVPTGRHEPDVRRRTEPPAKPEPKAASGNTGSEESLADQMIAGLAADGVADSQGKFTLDRDVARKKMREFQLADRAAYVLELVQAAVLKGAEHLDFRIDSDDMRLWFDGRPFTEPDFDHLYSSLFTSESDPDTRARQRLAIGVNAVLGAGPKFIHVSSGDGDGGARMVLSPKQEERIESLSPEDLDFEPGTQVHVKSRLGQRLSGDNTKIIEKIETACRYADAAIILNEKRISGGAILDGAYGVVELEGDGISGECGFTHRLGNRAEVRLIVDGVWISSYNLPDSLPGLLAVVKAGHLRKDLSQSEIVRDDAWQETMEAVYAAEGRAVTTFVQQLPRLLSGRKFPADWALDLLRSRCRSYSSMEDFRPGGAAEGLAKAPLWPTVAGTLVSLHSLGAQLDKTGHVDYADSSITALHLSVDALAQAGFRGHEVLLLHWLTDSRDGAFLAHLFDGRLRSVTDRLLQYLG